MELKGKTIVVTGASGSLGRAVVAALDGRGADCRLLSLRGLPGEEVAAFYRDLPEVWASVHVAGGYSMGPITETSLRDWEAMMEANARTAFLCSREAVRAMRRGGRGGRIVNVAAIPAIEPRKGAGMVAYAMSKAAVAALTVALAEEVAADGIWVNAVVPSILDTKANREAMPDADPARWAKVEEVAETIAFLVSPKNAVVRGALVPVNGRS